MKALVLGILMGCVVAYAAPITFTASLSGAAEFPPNASPATGLATVIIDDAAHTLFVDVTFSGLLGTTTAAHIHCCTVTPFTENAGVATTTPSFVGFPLGVTSGSYTNSFDTTDFATFRAGFIAASGGTTSTAEDMLFNGMIEGRAYFNIHTSVFGGGEIRGFLTPIPEPGTTGLLGAGLAVLALLGKRLRK